MNPLRDTEMLALDAMPELSPTPFPYRGHKDFRGFTQDDYDNWAGGVFQRVSDPNQAKWIGGKSRMQDALLKLLSLGYVVTVSVSANRFTLAFTSKTHHDITEAMQMEERRFTL
jgi:hypothetical protein